jgi:carbon-monoxide dehydrogenase medium subunit
MDAMSNDSHVTHRSRSRIPDFQLLRPRNLTEARAMLASAPAAMAMAGGLDVVNRMKDGLAPPVLVLLGGVADIDAIGLSPEGDTIEIGAGACHDALANSEVLRACLPDLAQCWGQIANIRIRMQGTVAGNLMALMPGYEGAVLLSALGASLAYSTREAHGHRIAVREFGDASEAFFRSGGLVEQVCVPLPAAGMTRRLLHDRSLRQMLSVALCVDSADGVVVGASAVVGGCHRWPFTCELPLAGVAVSGLAARAEHAAAAAIRQMPAPTAPWFGVASYRETVAPVLLSRLIREIAA